MRIRVRSYVMSIPDLLLGNSGRLLEVSPHVRRLSGRHRDTQSAAADVNLCADTTPISHSISHMPLRRSQKRHKGVRATGSLRITPVPAPWPMWRRGLPGRRRRRPPRRMGVRSAAVPAPPPAAAAAAVLPVAAAAAAPQPVAAAALPAAASAAAAAGAAPQAVLAGPAAPRGQRLRRRRRF